VAAYIGAKASRLDFTYYRSKHVDLARRLLARHGLTDIRVLGDFEPPPGDGPRMLAVSEMVFPSRAAFEAAMAAEGAALFADIQNFTDVEPILQISGRLDNF
jgi:uncharacterized protein (TIGR02118 family)